MADVPLATQQINASANGLAPSYTGSLLTSNVYKVGHDERTFLHFKKTGAGACVVTVVTPATLRGAAVAETTFSVPATTGDVMFGPFPADLYRDALGQISFTLSEITGLSVAALRV
jgi:hypothetical protein